MPGLGDLHHPVSTKNQQAQQFFDQGLRLIYAFNHDEAARSFQRAAELDPKLAMAYWGVAEAVGPNYNDPASDERFAEAHNAIQKAVDLSGNASPAEQAYIQAMALRFPADPKADRRQAAEAYHDAMREVAKKFPGRPGCGYTFRRVRYEPASLGLVAQGWNAGSRHRRDRRDPRIGAQARSQPYGRDPLLHSHRGGLGVAAAGTGGGEQAGCDGACRRASSSTCRPTFTSAPAITHPRSRPMRRQRSRIRPTSRASGAQGIYPMMYYSHNLHFIAMCSAMTGDYAEARQGAAKLAAHVGPFVKDMPPLEGFMTIPMAVDVRFHKWDDILKMPQPSADMKITTVFWHFARGMALAAKGKANEAESRIQSSVGCRRRTRRKTWCSRCR